MSQLVRSHSYFRTGGLCGEVIVPATDGEVASTVKRLWRNKVPYYLLGGGTNSLVSDESWDGAVLVLSGLLELHVADDVIRVGAGVENTAF